MPQRIGTVGEIARVLDRLPPELPIVVMAEGVSLATPDGRAHTSRPVAVRGEVELEGNLTDGLAPGRLSGKSQALILLDHRCAERLRGPGDETSTSSLQTLTVGRFRASLHRMPERLLVVVLADGTHVTADGKSTLAVAACLRGPVGLEGGMVDAVMIVDRKVATKLMDDNTERLWLRVPD